MLRKLKEEYKNLKKNEYMFTEKEAKKKLKWKKTLKSIDVRTYLEFTIFKNVNTDEDIKVGLG